MTPEEAFEGMPRDARSRRMKLHDVAAEIVATINVHSDGKAPR